MSETRPFQFKNFARSTLAAAIGAADTSLQVQTDHGARFPELDATYDEIFSIVVFNDAGASEVMYCTEFDGDTLTVERGKEGTTALAFDAGAAVVHTATAGFFERLVELIVATDPVLTGEVLATETATLTWTAPNGTVLRYDMYRAVSGGAASLLASDVTSPYEDSTMSSPTIYEYYVVAVMDDFTERMSNTVELDSAYFETYLLIHAENGELYEVTGVATVVPVGGGAMTTDQALFGTESFFNPGTATEGTNYVSVVGAEGDFVFDGEFTWEGWFYVEQYRSGFTNFVSNNIDYPNAGFIQLAVGTPGNDHLFFNSSGGVVSDATNGLVTAGEWHHIALTRDSSDVLRLFLDGDLRGTNSSGPTTIGGNNAGVSTFDLMRGIAADNDDVNGYIEEFRVTKACRYTASFTPPTAPFPPYP